jgi:hypothetical protein
MLSIIIFSCGITVIIDMPSQDSGIPALQEIPSYFEIVECC